MNNVLITCLFLPPACARAIQGVDWPFIKSGLDYKLGPSMWGSAPSAWWTVSQYQTDIGYHPPPPPVNDGSNGGPCWSSRVGSVSSGTYVLAPGHLAAVIVAPIVVTVMLVLAFAMYIKRSRCGSNLFGNVSRKGRGPTCLHLPPPTQTSRGGGGEQREQSAPVEGSTFPPL